MASQPPGDAREFQTPPVSPLAPAIVTAFVHGVILVLITSVVLIALPKFTEIFKSFGTELPARTLFVMRVGGWVKSCGLGVPFVVAGFIVLDALVYYHLRRHGATGWARAWSLFWLLLEGAAVVGIVLSLFLPLVILMTHVGAGAGQ